MSEIAGCGKCGRSKCANGYCPLGNDLRYTFPVRINLDKANPSTDTSRINVQIVASDPTPDRVNDVITLAAFEKAREDYLNHGILDYDHGSVRGATDLERARAIIGKPTDLDTKSGKVVVKGFLFKANPIVSEAIYPALEAGSDVFGASVGGRVIQKSLVWDEKAARKVNRISQITLNHVAITPRYKAVHPGTSLALAKSLDDEKGLLEFESFDAFAKSFAADEQVEKAIVAGFETDSMHVTGGQAIQPQSLEPGILRQIFDALLTAVREGRLRTNYDSIVGWLVNRGISPEDARDMAQVFAERAPRISQVFQEIG